MDRHTGQLFFIDGRFFEKVLIGNEFSVWDEKLVDITDEVVDVINKVNDKRREDAYENAIINQLKNKY